MKSSVEHASFDVNPLTRMRLRAGVHPYTHTHTHAPALATGTSSLQPFSPLSPGCVHSGLCCSERLKHLADGTLRVGENVSAWLSAWQCKTREKGQVRAGTAWGVWGYVCLCNPHQKSLQSQHESLSLSVFVCGSLFEAATYTPDTLSSVLTLG